MPGVGTTFDGETQEMAIKSANLPAPKEKEFSDNRPRTRDSWKLFEQLLDREGSLTNEASLEIEHGLKSIRVQEKVLEIEARLRSGGDLPDPTHPNASTRIAAADALGGGASAIVRWSAVKELGYEADEKFSYIGRAASMELYRILKRRGDFDNIFESVRPKPRPSTEEGQTPITPADFQAARIQVPIKALTSPLSSLQFFRYHLHHGLIVGTVDKHSFYDRGAGSHPGSGGRRVTEFFPKISPFLTHVNLRKYTDLQRKSVWRLIPKTNVIVGRSSSISAIERNMLPGNYRFWNSEDVNSFFVGEVESKFVQQSLTVEKIIENDHLTLRFMART